MANPSVKTFAGSQNEKWKKHLVEDNRYGFHSIQYGLLLNHMPKMSALALKSC